MAQQESRSEDRQEQGRAGARPANASSNEGPRGGAGSPDAREDINAYDRAVGHGVEAEGGFAEGPRQIMDDGGGYQASGEEGTRAYDPDTRTASGLTDDAYVDASDIEGTVAAGEVTRAGFVESRSERRRAEDIAESVRGVAYVQNNLRARQPFYGAADRRLPAETDQGESPLPTGDGRTATATSGSGATGASAGTGASGAGTGGTG